MPPETREWSVPTPVRALLWWPAISFVLVVVAPDAAAGVIIGAGAALALLGVALQAAARRLGRRSEPVEPPTLDFPTLDFPTLEMPPVQGDQAA